MILFCLISQAGIKYRVFLKGHVQDHSLVVGHKARLGSELQQLSSPRNVGSSNKPRGTSRMKAKKHHLGFPPGAQQNRPHISGLGSLTTNANAVSPGLISGLKCHMENRPCHPYNLGKSG